MSKRRSEPDYDCPWTFRVTEYLQEEMPSHARRDFEAHLCLCDRCAREVETERHTLARLGLVSSLSTPPTRPARETARLVLERSARRPMRPRTGMRRGSLAAAAMLLAAAVVWTGLHRARETSTPANTPTGPDRSPLAASRQDPPAATSGSIDQRAASAVTRALSWLASAQEDDGGWEPTRWGGLPQYAVGVNGLSVLALAGSDDDAHRAAARRGAMYLLTRQRNDGLLGRPFRGALYNHAVATRALLAVWQGSDAAVRSHLRAPIDRALDHVVAAQGDGGGWSYPDLGGPDRGNVSISVWPLRCLLVARGLGWGRLDPPIDRGFGWLRRVLDHEPRDLVRYRGHFDHACDAAGESLAWIVRESGGRLESVRRRALDRLARTVAEPADYYRAYLVSHAIRPGDLPWRKGRRDRAARDLLARQETGALLGGSWAPVDRWGALGGRLFSTALATLALDAPI